MFLLPEKSGGKYFEAPGNKNGKKFLIIIQFRIKYL
jgi:hypothetical protein